MREHHHAFWDKQECIDTSDEWIALHGTHCSDVRAVRYLELLYTRHHDTY